MTRIILTATAAGFIVTITPLVAISAPMQSENIKMAQVVQAPGVQVGPGGVTVGSTKPKCRTVTTTVEMPDGRKTTKKERRCEGE